MVLNNSAYLKYIQDSDNIEKIDPVTAYLKNIDLMQIPPLGSPPNLIPKEPSEIEKEENRKMREKHKYGGGGESPHLGGFTAYDGHGISPSVWRDILEYIGVKTLVDVGCGRGISTSWFYTQGVEVQCLEGSSSAIEQSILKELVLKDKEEKGETHFKVNPDNIVIQHDFSLGPWWPEKTVDAVWCVEVVEHIPRNFHHNLMTVFKKAAFVFLTYSRWGGWHHTEVHKQEWWISRLQSFGFVYSNELTERMRQKAKKENQSDDPYNAQHIWMNLLVFINPSVASLPEHGHLLAEPGCFQGNDIPNKYCHEATPGSPETYAKLPDNYHHILFKEAKQELWENYLSDIKDSSR